MSIFDNLLATAMMGEGGGGGGSSDLSTAEVRIVNDTNNHINCGIPYVDEEYGIGAVHEIYNTSAENDVVPLYKGKAFIWLNDSGLTVVVTGDITAIGDGYYDVTGNGTITIS